jgi:hypothetical protein
MSVLACVVFWKLEALTTVSGVALIGLAVVTGLAFAVTLYELLKRKYGLAGDDG